MSMANPTEEEKAMMQSQYEACRAECLDDLIKGLRNGAPDRLIKILFEALSDAPDQHHDLHEFAISLEFMGPELLTMLGAA